MRNPRAPGSDGGQLMTVTAALIRPPAAPVLAAGLVTVLLFGQFMAMLDVSIVNVAAPTVGRDLHASRAALQMVVAGYTISHAVGLITGARLGDRFGHGRVFRTGLLGFAAASLACGLAPNIPTLIGCRLAQDAAAALMIPQVMTLIQHTVTGPQRTRALSMHAADLAGGSVVGQIAGGLLVSADRFGTGWRPVFLIKVPVGALLVVLAARRLPTEQGDRGRDLDPVGAATLGLSVLLLVVPLVFGHQQHWPTSGWVCLALSGPVFAIFLRVEQLRRRPRPGTAAVTARAARPRASSPPRPRCSWPWSPTAGTCSRWRCICKPASANPPRRPGWSSHPPPSDSPPPA